jgi:hypothetical protein
MFRIGLSIYLMLATLPGPWLCCCSPEHLLLAIRQRFSAQPQQPSPHHQHDACCHKQPARAGKPQPACPQHSGNNRRPDQPCPYRDCGSWPTVLFSGGSEAGKHPLLRHASFVSLLFFQAPAPPLVLATLPGFAGSGPPVDLPFLTTGDLLHRLHMLRC